MNIGELLVPELQQESKLIEVFLRRIPEDKLDFTPHEKSMPLGKLASHLVDILNWIPATMNFDVLDMAGYQAQRFDNVASMISSLHALTPVAVAALQKDNEVYRQEWTMVHGDKVLMKMPRYTVMRSMVLNQFPHHRAQLGVYLRLLEVSVPATYGASADES